MTGARGHWDPVGSPMDLANDEIGRQCFTLQGTCEQACADSFHKGALYVLPRRNWSP